MSVVDEVVYKTSFDRFGDDLMELIVSYLSIADKFRFECLSKRIQSLIFNKHFVLKIDIKSVFVTKDDPKDDYCFYKIDIKSFETVIKKLKFLNEIQAKYRVEMDAQSIRAVADYCKHLRHIKVSRNSGITREDVEYFGRRVGQKLKSFGVVGAKDLRQLAHLAPDLEAIDVQQLRSILGFEDRLVRPAMKRPKLFPLLNRIRFFECTPNDLVRFQEQYADTITTINSNNNFLALISSKMSAFERLQSLSIDCLALRPKYVIEDEVFIDQIKLLAKLCPRLTKFQFEDDDHNYDNLFEAFGHFKNLVYLRCFAFESPNSGSDYGSIEKLKSLTKLRHLDLNLRDLNDTHFKNTDKALPNLESIVLETYKHITDVTLKYFSNLRSLRSLKIRCYNLNHYRNISDAGVQLIVDNCEQLRRLELQHVPQAVDLSDDEEEEDEEDIGQFEVSLKTINLFMKKAKNNPKLYYTLKIGEEMDVSKEFDRISNAKDFPNNLFLDKMQIIY